MTKFTISLLQMIRLEGMDAILHRYISLIEMSGCMCKTRPLLYRTALTQVSQSSILSKVLNKKSLG